MKNIKILLFITTLLILLAGCVKIPLGDGETLDISSDGATFSSEGEEEATIDTDEEDEASSISNDDGIESEASNETDESNVYFGVGENAEVPEEFPIKDLPIPEDATVTQVADVSVDSIVNITIIYMYDGDIDKLVEMYRDHFKNGEFDEVHDSTESQQEYTEKTALQIVANKDGGEFTIDISTWDDIEVTLRYGNVHEPE